MRNLAPQTKENVFTRARLRAAEYNPAFLNRLSASEELVTVSADCLKRYELGLSTPGSDVVAILADAYNAPELRAWYCANVCPLGDKEELPDVTPEGAVMRLTSALRKAARMTAEIAQMLDDGVLTPEERADYDARIRPELDELQRRAESLKLELDRAIRCAEEASK